MTVERLSNDMPLAELLNWHRFYEAEAKAQIQTRN